jgi:porphobilinogen deaminase
VAGYATTTPDGRLQLEGLLAAPDGSALVRRKAIGPVGDGARLGAEVAQMVLDAGGRDLLAARDDQR